MSNVFDDIYLKFQCGFSQGFNPQHCLIATVEKWRAPNDKRNSLRVSLKDLSNIFD